MHNYKDANLSPGPIHGGRLNDAVGRFGIPREQWLDLSTGINPNGWPVPPLPVEVFNRLPEDDDGLQQVACEYYGTADLLLLPGSQAGIQALPELRFAQSGSARVGVLDPAYAEHGFRWQQAGHEVECLEADQVEDRLAALDVLVLINPCNPSAIRFNPEQLRCWHSMLEQRGGWLLVDEAFIDATPEQSLITDPMPPGLIVLRSLGKFFGLAGIRVGAICAEASVREPLSRQLGPWAISHPARYITRLALADRDWQREMRASLKQQQDRLQALLEQYLPGDVSSTALFAYVTFAHVTTLQARVIEHRCAQAGILIRRFYQPAALRFGLPGDEADWLRLEEVLNEIHQ